MEDQRRRTLEALERRFAQAKTEVEIKQHTTKKRPIEVKDKVASNIETSNADSTSKKPRRDASARKGNFSFLGQNSSKQDAEVNEPAYFKLSHPVHENLLPNGVEVSDGKVTVNRVLHQLLQHGDAAQKYNQGSKNLKIENTILLDNFVQKGGMSSAGRNRAQQNGSKRSKKHMSLKQHKKSGSFDLPKEFHNFEIFKPMHDKWKGYIQQLLKIVGKDQLAQCFLNADLHGAIILVVECKIVSCVGTRGIMVRETKETFGIITQDNKFRGLTEYYVPICDSNVKIFKGQKFKSLRDIIQCYKKYAAKCGFDVRLGSQKRFRDGSFKVKQVYCNMQGEKYVSCDNEDIGASPVKKRTPRVSKRVGCKARVVFKSSGDDGYYVSFFHEEHCHMLVSDVYKEFRKGNKNLDIAHKQFVMNCARANIGATKSYRLFKEFVGGYSNIGCTKVDFKNFARDLKAYVIGT